MLKGDLSSFSLGEIFQSLAINNHTGTLRISSPDQKEKLIFFSEGEISLFSHGSPAGLRIGDVLIRMGAITFEDLDHALLEQHESKKLLGEILVETGLVTQSDLRQALCTKIQEEIYDLFLWKQGVFEFDMGNCPRDRFDELQQSLTVSLGTNSVIMEGLRRLDEWALIQQRLPTFDEIFIRTDKEPDDLDEIEKATYEQLDGVLSIDEHFPNCFGTRFEFCQIVCDLWSRGYARPLKFDECLTLADHALQKKRHVQAITALKFATRLNPEDPRLFVRLAETYAANYQANESRDAYLKAVRLFAAENDLEGVAAAAETLVPGSDLPAHDLEIIFHALVRTGNTKKAVTAGNQLVTVHQKDGAVEKATQTLKHLAHIAPRDLNLKLQTATLLDKAGRRDEAVAYLEDVAETLEEQKKYKDQLKILRLLATFDPERPQLKDKIAALQLRIESMAKRRKRRVGLMGLGVIGALLLSVLPMLYEIKSRELFKYAERIEQVALLSNDFDRARSGYVELVERFGFSTRVFAAEQALNRIENLEKQLVQSQTRSDSAAQHAFEAEVVETRKRFSEGLEQARRKENEGDLEGAHDIYRHLFEEFSEFALAQRILLPVRIDSKPRGAKISLNGVVVGSTPHVHRYEPGTAVEMTLSRHGCEPSSEKLTFLDQWEISRTLARSPARSFKLPEAVEQPLLAAAGRVVAVSRDGRLYAIDPAKGIVSWQRTVGRFGDRVSDLGSSGDQIYLSTVTGEVTALSVESGKSLWISRVEGPVHAAPTASPDRSKVAVASLSGDVYVLDNRDGSTIAAFRTENEIVTPPLFMGDVVVAGSTDNHVYGYSLPERSFALVLELTDDVQHLLVADDRRLLAVTRDAKVTLFSRAQARRVWTTTLPGRPTARPVIVGSRIHAVDRDGELTTMDLETGKVLWSLGTGDGITRGISVHGGRLYLSLENGFLRAVELSARQVLWEFRTASPVLAPSVVAGDSLFAISTSGQGWLFEVLR